MSSQKRKITNQHRVYNDRCESEYLISNNNNNKIQCIVCMHALSVPKEYNMKRHYTTLDETKQHQLSYDTLYCSPRELMWKIFTSNKCHENMTSHLNELNLTLQGKQQNIANLFGHINGFKNKIKLFRSSLQKNDFSFFPSCNEHFEEMKDFEEVSYTK
ncbi:unnamed protein product [Acanthoscelides obtectus]|uniref:SPIN-DOC-like zinc-finger domain-containing protein n=1 Tax=Acanthoscelides obtectus TaxID=200917 RepID=A0A9P0K232_ACAOB|nr:unnamed protein product [Acanthoscelides obtectus]CAK1629700.1 hypothetical protein AOBTE_LOCUS5903 [Acanthoscelides obtectus]